MKYKIVWTESHNPYNWGDTYEEGKQNILNSFPNPVISDFWTQMNNDEWLDLDCSAIYEMNTPQEAVKEWRKEYDAEVFSVLDETGKTVFTEEDYIEV